MVAIRVNLGGFGPRRVVEVVDATAGEALALAVNPDSPPPRPPGAPDPPVEGAETMLGCSKRWEVQFGYERNGASRSRRWYSV